MVTPLQDRAGMFNQKPSTPSKTPLNKTANATANTAVCPKKRITARYKPKRTNIGVLTATTAKYAGQSSIENEDFPAFRVNAAQSASGIMTESAQIAITLLIGLGSSTACLARSPVVSPVFDIKMTLR